MMRKMLTVALVVLLCFGVATPVCAEDDVKLEETIRMSGYQINVPDSVGGVDLTFHFTNMHPTKDIKYCILVFKVFDRVQEPLTNLITGANGIRVQYTGPLAPGKSNFQAEDFAEDAFYNATAHSCLLVGIDIEYMDGETITLDEEQVYELMSGNLFPQIDTTADAYDLNFDEKIELPRKKMQVGVDIKPGLYRVTGENIFSRNTQIPLTFSMQAEPFLDDGGYLMSQALLALVSPENISYKTSVFLDPGYEGVVSLNSGEWIDNSISGLGDENQKTFLEPLNMLELAQK